MMPLVVWLCVGWPIAGWGTLFAAVLAGLVPYAVAIVAIEMRWRIRQLPIRGDGQGPVARSEARDTGRGRIGTPARYGPRTRPPYPSLRFGLRPRSPRRHRHSSGRSCTANCPRRDAGRPTRLRCRPFRSTTAADAVLVGAGPSSAVFRQSHRRPRLQLPADHRPVHWRRNNRVDMVGPHVAGVAAPSRFRPRFERSQRRRRRADVTSE